MHTYADKAVSEAGFPSKEGGGNGQILDLEVFLTVWAMCDLPTKSKLCLLRKSWREDLQDLLFRNVKLESPHQLGLFKQCVETSQTNGEDVQCNTKSSLCYASNQNRS